MRLTTFDLALRLDRAGHSVGRVAHAQRKQLSLHRAGANAAAARSVVPAVAVPGELDLRLQVGSHGGQLLLPGLLSRTWLRRKGNRTTDDFSNA